MKTTLLSLIILFSLASGRANAQVNININLGTPVVQQPWYADDDNYYYLPEQDVYYNVTRNVYVFPDNGNWLYAPVLPPRYNGYTYQRSHYVVLRERAPFTRSHNWGNYQRHYYSAHRAPAVRRAPARRVSPVRHYAPVRHAAPVRRHDNGNHYGSRNHGNGRIKNNGNNGHGNGRGHGKH